MGLAGDAVDLLPFVTGVGETIKTLKATSKNAEGTDDAINTYNVLKRINKGNKLEVHHIVEKRFVPLLGYNKYGGRMHSIALTSEVHQIYTNKWREALGYGKNYTEKNVLLAAITVYKDDPTFLGAAIYTITKNRR